MAITWILQMHDSLNNSPTSSRTPYSLRVMRTVIVCCAVWVAGNFSQKLFAQIVLPKDVLEKEQARIAVIEKATPAVVAIFPPDGRGGGSGVLISPDGITLTNYHVVEGAGPFLKCGLSDGNVYDAVLMGIDPTGDVAIIRMLGRDDFPFAPLGDSDTVKVGDWAFAMGNPFLLADDFVPTLTFGMVSGIQRYQYPAGTFLEYTDCIQVDTSINPGNSGGPLFNVNGEVVGINGRISVEKRGRVNAGAGYAISINQIKNFSDHLQSGRVVDHATLGATVRTDEFSNVIVETVIPTCSAFFHGLRAGDEIVSFGGRPVGSVNQFKNVLGIYPKGWKIPLVYRRDGERYEIYPRLEPLHSVGELIEFASAPAPAEEPEDKPENVPPIPMLPHQKAPEIPEEYAHLYESRLGYANYYYNRIKQEELLATLKILGDYGQSSQKWTLTGNLKDGGAYRLVLADFASLFESPGDGQVFLLDSGRPETFMAGPYSSGMLMSLRELQQLLISGPDIFSEIVYIGSEPLDGVGAKVDVLSTLHEDRQIRWYFDRDAKQLVGWDTKFSEDRPECGVRIPGWKTGGPYAVPQELKILVAGQPEIILQVDDIQTESVDDPKL